MSVVGREAGYQGGNNGSEHYAAVGFVLLAIILELFYWHHHQKIFTTLQGHYGAQYETARVGQYDGAAALYNYPNPSQMSPRYTHTTIKQLYLYSKS